MDLRYCYGCMKQISEDVCPHCGTAADAANAPQLLAVGTELQGRYLVGRAIAQGERTVTYIALDRQEEAVVQLKEFFPRGSRRGETGVLPDEGMAASFSIGREMFAREAEAMCTIRLLAQVSGARTFFESNATAYLVTENLKGIPLSRYISLRGGRLSADEVFRLLKPMLEAVAALHRAGLTHGAVRLENVLLDPMGGARLTGFFENGRVDPADDVFGLCRVLCGCFEEGGHTRTIRLKDIPGLTAEQVSALEVGLAPDPQSRFANAPALCRALFPQAAPAAVPVAEPKPAVPAAPKAQPEEMPVTTPFTPDEMPVTTPFTPDEMPVTTPFDPDAAPAAQPVLPVIPREAPPKAEKPKAAPGDIAPTELMTDFKLSREFLEAQERAARRDEEARRRAAGAGEAPKPAAQEEIPLGRPPMEPADRKPDTVEKPVAAGKPGSKKPLILVAAIAAVLLVVAVVCFFTVHIWKDATCRSPRICRLCGKTEGQAVEHDFTDRTCTEDSVCIYCGTVKAAATGHTWREATCTSPRTCSACGTTEGTTGGHTWQEATCTSPKTCTTCGINESAALGHDWQEATYTAPETCSRCGATRGNIKGFYPDPSGNWEALHYGSANTYAYVLNTPLKKVTKFTVNFYPEFSQGIYVPNWKLIYRDGNGNWHEHSNFSLGSDGNAYVTFSFTNPTNVSAIAVIPAVAGGYSYSFDFEMVDVYTKE